MDHVSDTRLRVETMNQLIQRHPGPTLTLYYEHMTLNSDEEIHKILTFLGVRDLQLAFTANHKSSAPPWKNRYQTGRMCVNG